jgi:hypothetical protein
VVRSLAMENTLTGSPEPPLSFEDLSHPFWRGGEVQQSVVVVISKSR